MLSAELPRSRILQMMVGMPLVVARREGRVVGFLTATTRAMNADLPVVAAMFSVLRGQQPGREGVLFIRIDKQASLLAHWKMGMNEVARFDFNGANFAVFSYVG